MSVLDKDGVIVLGSDTLNPQNNITIKTPAVADGSLEIYKGVPGALGDKLFGFDAADTDFNAKTKTATNASGDAPIYACRAWVNFDGTTTPPTIRASGNVSSVTKNGTGDYTVNFTTAMPDATFAAVISPEYQRGWVTYGKNASQLKFTWNNTTNGAATDAQFIDVAIFR